MCFIYVLLIEFVNFLPWLEGKRTFAFISRPKLRKCSIGEQHSRKEANQHFLKGHPRDSFIFNFSIFQRQYNSEKMNMKNGPCSIWYWDTNPCPLNYESAPMTPRPWLPSTLLGILLKQIIESLTIFANLHQ